MRCLSDVNGDGSLSLKYPGLTLEETRALRSDIALHHLQQTRITMNPLRTNEQSASAYHEGGAAMG